MNESLEAVATTQAPAALGAYVPMTPVRAMMHRRQEMKLQA